MSATALNRRIQQLARRVDLPSLECLHAVVQQLLRLALLLGQRASGAFDVCPRPRVLPIEEERARPDIDRLCVVRCEVVVEAAEQQAFDLGVALGGTVGRRRDEAFDVAGAERIGHISDRSRPPDS